MNKTRTGAGVSPRDQSGRRPQRKRQRRVGRKTEVRTGTALRRRMRRIGYACEKKEEAMQVGDSSILVF